MLRKSATRTFRNGSFEFIRELRFEDQPIVTLYRGGLQSEEEIRRLFKMDWPHYSERPSPKVKGNPFDRFSGGKYFSIDRAVAQDFALGRLVQDDHFHHFVVEVKVPREVVSKRNRMAQWNFAEFQYDPVAVSPEEVEAFTLFFEDGNSIRVSGELLRSKDPVMLYQYLVDQGLDPEAAKRLSQ